MSNVAQDSELGTVPAKLQLTGIGSAFGAKSEQATLHSAPSPWTLLFDRNCRISLFAFDVKFLGPVVWQNLGGKVSPITKQECSCNLWLPRERKSPPLLGRQFAFGCATSNLRQDTTKAGQDLVFCNYARKSLGDTGKTQLTLKTTLHLVFCPYVSPTWVLKATLCFDSMCIVWGGIRMFTCNLGLPRIEYVPPPSMARNYYKGWWKGNKRAS